MPFTRTKNTWLTFLVVVTATLNSTAMAIIVAAIPLFVGFMARGHEAALLASFPFAVSVADDAKPIYMGLIVFLVVLGLREWSKSRSTRKKETELLHTIRTMPPPDVLKKLHALFGELRDYIVEHVHNAATPDEKKQAVDSGMRLGLNSLAVLVASFQRSPLATRYAANFMIYRPLSSATDADKNHYLQEIDRFVDQGCIEHLNGVLELLESWSATSDSATPFEQDTSVRKLILPVPSTTCSVHNGKTRCLPGAPTAFALGQYIVNDTWRILEEFDRSKSYEIVRGVFERMDHYFRNTEPGKRVRSFLSLSVPRYGALSAGGAMDVVGVINIHSDRENLFEDDWVFHSFQYLVSPIVDQIALLASQKS